MTHGQGDCIIVYIVAIGDLQGECCMKRQDVRRHGLSELYEAYWSITSRLENGMGNHGLNTGNPKIFLYLVRNEGCQQKDLARNCYVKSATLSTVLSNMEKNGFIERRRLEDNKRAYAIYLTDKGRKIRDMVEQRLDDIFDAALSDFSADEIEKLKEYLVRMRTNVDAY